MKFKEGMVVKVERMRVTLVKKLTDVEGGWFTTPGPDGFRYWNELDMKPIAQRSKRTRDTPQNTAAIPSGRP